MDEGKVSVAAWADMHEYLASLTWIWPKWLASGVLSLVVSEIGQGKSALCLRLAACFIRGDCFPDGSPFVGDTGAVLWCETESAQIVNLERATALGLPLDRLLTPLDNPLENVQIDNPAHREAIAIAAARSDVKLIVVNSLRCSRQGGENIAELVGITEFLANLARDINKPLLLTYHLQKHSITASDGAVATVHPCISSPITQAAHLVWALSVPDLARPETRRLSVIKSKLACFPEPVCLTVTQKGIII